MRRGREYRPWYLGVILVQITRVDMDRTGALIDAIVVRDIDVQDIWSGVDDRDECRDRVEAGDRFVFYFDVASPLMALIGRVHE